MKMVTEVVNKARNRLQFDSECRPDSLARQSLLECSSAAKKLEDISVDKAVDLFQTKWTEKVLLLICVFSGYLLVVAWIRFSMLYACVPRWWIGLVVAYWSRSTKLLYISPD